MPTWEQAYILELEQSQAKMAQFDREEAQRRTKVQQMMAKVRGKLGL